MEPFVQTNHINGPALLHIAAWNRLNPLCTAGFSTRLGGVGEAEMASLNCALHVPDNPEHVAENRKRIAEALGFTYEDWTCAEQVHDSRVAVITRKEQGAGRADRESAIASTDGMISDEKGVLLTAFFADCVPLFFFDPVRVVIGIAHAGWKGTVLNIAGETVKRMRDIYGCNPANMHAAIGPAIGACCYEVDDTVIGRVKDALEEARIPSVHAEITGGEEPPYIDKGAGKYLLDLKEMNRRFMIKAGILPSGIELSTLCTSCRTDLFFSHRKEKGRTGRMIGWIGLKKG